MLQLSRETGPTLDSFAGFVEHLASGHRVRFETFEDFKAAVIRVLGEGDRDEAAIPARAVLRKSWPPSEIDLVP